MYLGMMDAGGPDQTNFWMASVCGCCGSGSQAVQHLVSYGIQTEESRQLLAFTQSTGESQGA